MSASSLSGEAWLVIGTLIGFTVLVCLWFIANVIDYENAFRHLVRQVKALRAELTGEDGERRQPGRVRRAEPMGREWDAKFAPMRRERREPQEKKGPDKRQPAQRSAGRRAA